MEPNGLMTAAFWTPTGIGVLGLLGWFVKAFADPKNDAFTSIFADFGAHGRSFFVALIGYATACVIAFEASQLTIVAAIGLGYMAQSGSSAFMPAKDAPKP